MIYVAVTACGSSEPINVMVYNIHAGRDVHAESNLAHVAELIARENADIVFLQEVDKRTERSGGEDQITILSEFTDMNGIFGKTLDYQGGEYGIGLLTRWPVSGDTMIPLDVRPPQERAGGSREPRGALIAHIETPSGPIVIINTHLHASADDRFRMQEVVTLRRLADSLSRDYSVLVGGDFNSQPESRVIGYMLESGWRDAWDLCGDGPGHTYPSDLPDRRIDYLFLQRGMSCVAASTPNSDASDHRPASFSVLP